MTEKSPIHCLYSSKLCAVALMVILFWTITSTAQVLVTPSVLDYGTTNTETDWVRDIVVTNQGHKSDFLLRHTFSHEYGILLSTKSFAPDSTLVIRVQFKPREKTRYDETILLYFASAPEPVKIRVVANVAMLNPEDHLACPDFSRLAKDCCPNFMFLAEVIDAKTQLPIPKAKIQFQPIDGESLRLLTNNQGKLSYDLPIHYYYIKVSAEGYKSQLIETYINHRNNNLHFQLEALIPSPIEPVIAETIAPTASVSDSTVLPQECLPNNILFLLDVSASMAKEEKLALMKASITELAKVLRPQDQITLMVYAQEAKLLLATTSGSNKTEIQLSVSGLRASGNTNGAEGFKEAYKTLLHHRIKNGNNQLYVITDGAFAPTDYAIILKSVKRSKRKNINTSIIGIRANIFAQQNLNSLAQIGGGQIIAIDENEDLIGIIDDLIAHSLVP